MSPRRRTPHVRLRSIVAVVGAALALVLSAATVATAAPGDAGPDQSVQGSDVSSWS